MGIFTVIVFGLVLATLTAIYEGGKAAHERHKENKEWRRERREYYPKRKAWMA